MRNFFKSLLDFLHAYIDMFTMAIIILVITLTINWRLNILFTKNMQGSYAEDNISQGEAIKPKPPVENQDSSQVGDNNELEDKDNELEENNQEKDDEIEKVDKDPDKSEESISITVPKGASSTKIGEILASKGLVSNSKEFISKAVEMNLDRKLQPGDFKIPKNTSLEDLVKIIAEQK